MTLFITGAQSFIGTELLAQCRQRKLDTLGADVAPAKDGCLQADIRDTAIADLIPEGADALIHLAAVSRDADCRANPKLAFDVNVMGTLNLIEAAKKRKVKQFIFASSEWVYGDVRNEEVQVETQPIDAMSVLSEYAFTKIIGEQCLRMAQKQGLESAITILRFGIVYGPRPTNWSAVEALFNTVRTQDTISVGSLATGRRFIHVADIAAGILSAVGRMGFEIFNLGGNTVITLRDIIEQSAELLGRRPQIVEKNPQAISLRNPDNTKARQVLGWEPNIILKEGLATLLPR